MNKKTIKAKIKQLDTKNIIKKIDIGVIDGTIIIDLSANYNKVSILYDDEGMNINYGYEELYIENGKDDIPLIIFAYKNKDKIKQIIKEA